MDAIHFLLLRESTETEMKREPGRKERPGRERGEIFHISLIFLCRSDCGCSVQFAIYTFLVAQPKLKMRHDESCKRKETPASSLIILSDGIVSCHDRLCHRLAFSPLSLSLSCHHNAILSRSRLKNSLRQLVHPHSFHFWVVDGWEATQLFYKFCSHNNLKTTTLIIFMRNIMTTERR